MLDVVARPLLFAVLLAQAQRVRASVEPLPEPPGPRAGRESAGGVAARGSDERRGGEERGGEHRGGKAWGGEAWGGEDRGGRWDHGGSEDRCGREDRRDGGNRGHGRDRGGGGNRRGGEGPGGSEGRGDSEGRGGGELGLLVVGDSSAAGVGAPHQDLALARPLARRLAQRLQRPVRWTLIAQSGLTSAATLAHLKAHDVPAADLAVVVVGVNDITSQVPQAAALKHRSEIAVWLEAHAGVAQVLFPALPEMERFPSLPQPLAWWAGQAARRNNRAQARWARQWPLARPRVAHVPMDGVMRPDLMAVDGFHPGPGLYARVAEHLAEAIARDARAQDFSEEKA